MGNTIDISNCQTVFSVGLRYFQGGGNTNAYGDAPVFLRLFSGGTTTAKREIGALLYQSSQATEKGRYPNWIYKTVFINNGAVHAFTNTGFDLTKVSQVELYGTDWAGVGQDFVDFKDLVISTKLGVYPNLDNDIAFPGYAYSREFLLNTCGSTPTWELVSGPAGMTIDPATGKVSWTPSMAVLNQSYAVTVKATSDGTDYTET